MYSNAVKISDLNDYLNPSEECVLPLTKKEEKYEIKLNDRRPELKDGKSAPNLKNEEAKQDLYRVNKLKVTRKDKNNKITVGLSDCLSCSGCLTSSEEILLKEDNKKIVLDKMRENKPCVVSISPQTIFMFSSYYDVSPEKALGKLSHLFRKLGAKWVFTIGLAELVTLDQSKEEFILRYREERRKEGNNHQLGSSKESNSKNGESLKTDSPNLPVISSHCPGWTLYAEKTLEEELVRKISRVPSSQVTQGLLVKLLSHTLNYLGSKEYLNYIQTFKYRSQMVTNNLYPVNRKGTSQSENCQNHKVYHVCVVPCYDKKFEMIRNEYKFDSRTHFPFLNTNNDPKEAESGERLVDDILSTQDIDNILREMKVTFKSLKEDKIDQLEDFTDYFAKFASISLKHSEHFTSKYKNVSDLSKEDKLANLIKCSQFYCQSGGFAEEIFRQSCLDLFGLERDKVVFKQTINSDFKECVLTDEHDNVLLRFAISYGFNNVQNSIRLIKNFSTSTGHSTTTHSHNYNNNNNNNTNNYSNNNNNNNNRNINNNNNNNSNNNKNNSNNNNSNNNNCTNNNNNNIKNNNKRDKFDYLEVMSCPGGCFNGAGQNLSRPPAETNKFSNFWNKTLRYLPAGVSKLVKLNRQRTNIQATGRSAFERFLAEAVYVTTDHPTCRYFSEFISLFNSSNSLQLRLSSLKNSNNSLNSLKW